MNDSTETKMNGDAETGGENETDGFIGNSNKKKQQEDVAEQSGFCYTKHAFNCCIATGAFGILFIVLGLVILVAGKSMLQAKILKSMAISPRSDRYESWLTPPVQPHLSAYAFHVVNPNAVLEGKKPIVKEVGPFVYKSVTIKDSDDNVQWHDNGTMTYRPRKVYTFVKELSGVKDPDNTFVTVPNIPLWTGLNGLRAKSGFARNTGIDIVTTSGLNTPFINVSLSGLLWGYKDELPCLKLDLPAQCASEEDSPFAATSDDDWGSDEWKRKKRSTRNKKIMSELDLLSKPKAEFIDCECNWGLFRDRNVTMRKPVEFMTGMADLSQKGIVTKFDGKTELGWWKKGSFCDKVRGHDSSTLPPGIVKDKDFTIFISLMCRPLPMTFEKDTEHAGIKTYRFIPPENAMGAHDDTNALRKNPDNECYCLKEDNFDCFKSGVTNMQPCKRDTNAPLALSYPHFYQADQSFLDAVGGLHPEKEKHQFYMDVVPEFGFPLAIRPRFQLNIVIGDFAGWAPIEKMTKKIVLPFLWAQDGFDEPSEKMAEAIAFGLSAPDQLSLLGAVICFVIGGALLLSALGFFLWHRKFRLSDIVGTK